MSWNGSDQTSSPRGRISAKCADAGDSAVRRTAPTKAGLSIVHLLSRPAFFLPALLLAILSLFLWWIFGGRGATRPVTAPTDKRNSKIVTVAPNIVTNAPPRPAPPPAEEPKKPLLDEKGRPLLTNVIKNSPGRRTPRPVRVIKFSDTDHSKPPIFHAMSDCHLGQLANYQPGERFLSIVSPADIAKDFMEHAADMIEVSPDDPPDIAERKRNYAEVREQIKKDILAGGDLEQMIVEARRTLNKIADMREEYQKVLEEAKAGGARRTTNWTTWRRRRRCFSRSTAPIRSFRRARK